MARRDTIGTILALAAYRNWQVYQVNVKSAFLHGALLEHVYVDQPLNYEKEGREKGLQVEEDSLWT